ncbi:hypothetical protein D3C86_2187340 [compost metagenome]
MPVIPKIFEIPGVKINKKKSNPEFPGNIIPVFQARKNTDDAGPCRNDGPIEQADLLYAIPVF